MTDSNAHEDQRSQLDYEIQHLCQTVGATPETLLRSLAATAGISPQYLVLWAANHLKSTAKYQESSISRINKRWWDILCSMPRHSFMLNEAGGVMKVVDKTGNWVDIHAVIALYELMTEELGENTTQGRIHANERAVAAALAERQQADIMARWQARALKAENRLLRANVPGAVDTISIWGDDEYLLLCLEHKDGRAATTTDLLKARSRVLARQAGLDVGNALDDDHDE